MRIFASYDSCRRQSLNDEERKHILCKKYMADCLFFSIAVDTALFQNEHHISCMARFSFGEKIIVAPLFITPCLVSSGNDLAIFIFNALKDKDAPFHKLVSVATDGATNMMGKYNGMTTIFNNLVVHHCREKNIQPNLIHTIWCFALRLNLVTKHFLALKPANVVLAFADWFTNKRRQVSYKRFLATNTPHENLRAIPQPSETRWLFYRDVLSAILSQKRSVEQFVLREAEFRQFWVRIRSDAERYGPCVTRDFSFSNNLIGATFSFTWFVLDLLGRKNTIFQERFISITELWDAIVSLMVSHSNYKAALFLLWQ